MNFDLTEERQMLQDSLRRFLRDKYDTAARNKILESDTGFSADIWNGLAELGVIGALFTEDQGGFGGAGFDIAVVFEELGRAGVVEPFLDTAILGGGLIADLGNDDQQAHVEELIGGALQVAFAHGEPTSRYDLNQVTSTAKVDGDNVVLNGRKAVVVNAENADMLIVSARESGEAGDENGISLFLVPADTKGITLQGYALLAGGRAAEVTLDDVSVPASARLGEAGKAFKAIEARVAAANVAICAETLGAMETATRLTREYLMTRKQFGKPIGTFQAPHVRPADRDGASALCRDRCRGQPRSGVQGARDAYLCRQEPAGSRGPSGCRRQHPDARRYRHDARIRTGPYRQAYHHGRPPLW